MEKFTVDTHLFRELGELLVGRASTALIELIKNSYDADATLVTVFGANLSQPEIGRITITDNGVGMTPSRFRLGFLRIAARIKEENERRSFKFKRRFTGAKGVGRLAAHKLARELHVISIPNLDAIVNIKPTDRKSISATINWDTIENLETLDQIENSDAITLEKTTVSGKSGTTIELRKLRQKWTPSERTRFFWEVQTFQPPTLLVDPPRRAFRAEDDLLFKTLSVRDSKQNSPFRVKLDGEFDTGEEYWQTIISAANWLLEINATPATVSFVITPTKTQLKENSASSQFRQTIVNPNRGHGPSFHARILIREGSKGVKRSQREWVGRAAGIRVYMEGFRVLPYGEPNDDWLSIDSGYVARGRLMPYLEEFGLATEGDDKNTGLNRLRKNAYFGAIFLTLERSQGLQMLVNREGFIPNANFDNLRSLVQLGIDLSVRHRVSTRHEKPTVPRDNETEARIVDKWNRKLLRDALESAVSKAANAAISAKQVAATGDYISAKKLIENAAQQFSLGSDLHERLLYEHSYLQILASIGLQMKAFVHEMNSLLGIARTVERVVKRIRRSKGAALGAELRKTLGEVEQSVGDLRRVVERQASYLTDVSSPDARRRRSRQSLRERFEAALRLAQPAIERRKIDVAYDIPSEIRTPPMFPSEVTLVISNLLSNAVKAAGRHGKIEARAFASHEYVQLTIENTGDAVDLITAEEFFRPYKSTTSEVDPFLGQGMGMGLVITRNILEEYGASIKFVSPTQHFQTAIKVEFDL